MSLCEVILKNSSRPFFFFELVNVKKEMDHARYAVACFSFCFDYFSNIYRIFKDFQKVF